MGAAREGFTSPARQVSKAVGHGTHSQRVGRPAWLAPGCEPPSFALAELIHDQFRALVLHPGFSCLGAKSAFRGHGYRLGIYHELGSPRSTEALMRDLAVFVAMLDQRAGDDARPQKLQTFVASFLGPVSADDAAFERLLWTQLQALHDRDPASFWDPTVSSDPEDAHFSFSIAGRAFFVVGLHAASERWARRFAWPTLVFNPHAQFEQLRERGHFARLQRLIRAREHVLQGSINANLSDFGDRSEARQYSGRPVEDGWHCPFQVKTGGQQTARTTEGAGAAEDRC